MRGREHLGQRLLGAAEHAVGDRLLVDRLGDGTAHAGIVQRFLLNVHREIGDALGQHRHGLGALRGLELGGEIAVEIGGEVRGAGHQIGDARRGIGNRAEDDARERRLGAPVGVVAIERHRNAALPRAELVGAAADRREIEGVLAHGLDDLLRHDRELDELREQGRIGTLRGQRHRFGVVRDGVDDLVELAELRAGELRISDALDAEDDVVGGQLRAVMEGDVIAQLELDLRVGKLLPRGCDLRRDDTLVVTGDEIVEDVAVDVVAVRVPLDMRIERVWLADEVDRQTLLGGEGRAPRQRQASGEQRACEHSACSHHQPFPFFDWRRPVSSRRLDLAELLSAVAAQSFQLIRFRNMLSFGVGVKFRFLVAP